MEKDEALKIAKNRKSNAEQLKALLGISDEIDLLLAKHPSSTAEMLDDICERQSFNEKICATALAHPNTSAEQLLNVGWEYPMAMFRNPSLPSLMQSRKNFLGEFSGEEFEASLKKELPEFVVDWLLSQGKAEYQLIYVSAPKRSPVDLEKFRVSKHAKVVATLLDKDINAYLAWATDLGLRSAIVGQFAPSDLRSNIDAWVGWLAGKNAVALQPTAKPKADVAPLPRVLASALKSIEASYFQCGRVAFNESPNFYDEFAKLLQDTLSADVAFSKLITKVREFDLSEIKRFGKPGKKAPPDIAKGSYYAKSGLEKSFNRLVAILASWSVKQPETRWMALSEALTGLVANHPLPGNSGGAALASTPPARSQDSRPVDILANPLEQDDQTYLEWAMDLGFTRPTAEGDGATGLKLEIDDWVESLWLKNHALSKALVPESGCAPTLQGELLRALGRIESEHFKNGMTNWGDGSGFYEAFTQLIHDTLKSEKSFSKMVKKTIDADIGEIKKSGQVGKAIASGRKPREAAFDGSVLVQCDVEMSHQRLGALITLWCQRHPEPISYSDK